MKPIKLIMLALVAACALGGVTASSALAEVRCPRVAEPRTGKYQDPLCTIEQANGEYIKVSEIGPSNSSGIACARVAVNGTGNWSNSQCTEKGVAEKNWIRVYEPPVWTIQGKQVKQGATQLKLQLKGAAKLKVPSIGLTIECKGSGSEGATIEGSGTHQGQDKGRVTYSQCTSNSACPVAEPITTSQIKSYLAIANTQTKIVDVYTPTEGSLFTKITLNKGCVLAGTYEVNGAVAAEIIPAGEEVQEGLTVFPETAITKVTYEGEEQELVLKTKGLESTFSGAYGAQLQSQGKYGVVGTD